MSAREEPDVLIELQLCVRRKNGSLGFAVSKQNVVVDIKLDGQAAQDGLLQAGDHVIGVDGIPLNGQPMAQALTAGKEEYDFIVTRRDHDLTLSLERLPPSHPAVAEGSALQLTRAYVTRDANGLGLDMTGTNILKRIVAGGAAERCGALQLNDVVVAVDGVKLGSKRVVEVMTRGAQSVTFTILRAIAVDNRTSEPVQDLLSAAPPQATSTVAAAAKGSGGVLERIFGGWGGQPALSIAGEEYRVTTPPPVNPADTVLLEAFRARDQQKFAVKRMNVSSREQRSAALREAKLWAIISPPGTPNHPSIVGFLGQQFEADFCYLVMELCPGGTLENWVASRFAARNPPTSMEVGTIMSDICGGLALLHGKLPRLVHCDLTLQKIVAGVDGHWKLSDFSMLVECANARLRFEELQEKLRSDPDALAHCLVCYAPEVSDVASGLTIDEQVDIWSAGLILLALLTGNVQMWDWSAHLKEGLETERPLYVVADRCTQRSAMLRPKATALSHLFAKVSQGLPSPIELLDAEGADVPAFATLRPSAVPTAAAAPIRGVSGIPAPSARPAAVQRVTSAPVPTRGPTAGAVRPQLADDVPIRLRVRVQRGEKGLGIAVDSKNVVQSLQAGHLLEVGDRIVGVDGRDIRGAPLAQAMKERKPEHEFEILRSDSFLSMSLRRLPGTHPLLEPEARVQLVRAVITRKASGLGVDMSGNNVLRRMVPGSAAERTGALVVNDVVIAVDGVKLGTKKVIEVLSRDSASVAFTILRSMRTTPSVSSDGKKCQATVPCAGSSADEAKQGGSKATQPTSPIPSNAASAAALAADVNSSAFWSSSALPPAQFMCAKHAPHSAGSEGADTEEAAGINSVRNGGRAPDTESQPSDTDLLNYLLDLQGLDRASLLKMYSSMPGGVQRQDRANPKAAQSVQDAGAPVSPGSDAGSTEAVDAGKPTAAVPGEWGEAAAVVPSEAKDDAAKMERLAAAPAEATASKQEEDFETRRVRL